MLDSLTDSDYLGSGTITLPRLVEHERPTLQSEPISEPGKRTEHSFQLLHDYLSAPRFDVPETQITATFVPAMLDLVQSQAIASFGYDIQTAPSVNWQEFLEQTSIGSWTSAVSYGSYHSWPRAGVLADLYEIDNPTAINEYLTGKVALLDFLATASKKIAKFFAAPRLGLEVITTPEESGFEQLLLYIKVAATDDSAFERLNKLDREWWLDQSCEFPDLCVSLRYE